MSDPVVILPREYADAIEGCGARHGLLHVRSDPVEGVYVIDGYMKGHANGGVLGGSQWVKDHYLGSASRDLGVLWYEVELGLHMAGLIGARKAGMMSLESFRKGVLGGWINPAQGGTGLAVTYATHDGTATDWQAWEISADEDWACPVPIQIVDESELLLAPLGGDPEVSDLHDVHAVIVGAGSIGSHALDALASYGVRHMTLVDPDRLLVHNFARHRASRNDLGRFKVTAERSRLLARDPDLAVDALKLDVVFDADAIRPLFGVADVVLVTADGIDARRTSNHLARRAGTPAVFACVLENGGYGEVVRVGRASSGCLWCARQELLDGHGIEPEVGLDRGYGQGTRHLPMTAVPGDLGLVGQLAAKVTVATLLEAKGHRDQALPGDQAVLSLRPRPDRSAPFDTTQAAVLTWRPLPMPRADCPSCNA